MPTRRSLGPHLVVATALTLAACGGSDGADDSDAVDSATTTDPATTESDGALPTTTVAETAPTTTAATLPPSGAEQMISVDLGGAPPTDPDVVAKLEERAAFLAERGIDDTEDLLAYQAIDRGLVVLFEQATLTTSTATWSVDDAGNRLSTSTRFALDGTDLTQEDVADQIVQALRDAGLDDPVRETIDGLDGPYVSLRYPMASVGVVGVSADPFFPNTFQIEFGSSHDDIEPRPIGGATELEAALTALAPDAPLSRVVSAIELAVRPTEQSEIWARVASDPDAFDEVVAQVDAAADDAMGADRSAVLGEALDDLVGFEYGDGRTVVVERDGEGVTVGVTSFATTDS